MVAQSTARVGLLRRLNPYGFPGLMVVIPLVLGTSILGLGFNYYLIFIGELMPIAWVLSAGVAFTLSCGLTRLLLALTNLLLPTDARLRSGSQQSSQPELRKNAHQITA